MRDEFRAIVRGWSEASPEELQLIVDRLTAWHYGQRNPFFTEAERAIAHAIFTRMLEMQRPC